MAAGFQNFCIEKGAPWSRTFTWQTGSPAAAVDLTGGTAVMRYVHTKWMEDDAEEITTEDGGITLGGADGTVQLDLTQDQVDDLEEGKYIYQVTVTLAGVPDRVLQGALFVSADI